MAVLREYAKDYLKSGVSVIPLQPKGKTPLLKWTEFQKRKPTLEEITTWWEKTPDANIGIVTGKISRLLVIDIDTKEGWEFVKQKGYGAKACPIVETGGGGVHLYYRYPDGEITVGARIGEERHGIDYRGEGGYVVAPPSQHTTGKYYKWNKYIPDFTIFRNLPEPPKWILEEIKKIKKYGGEESIKNIAKGVKKGGRNNAAARVAGLLLSKFPEKDWPMCWEFLKGWNQNNNPPLPEDELQLVFRSISFLERKSRRERQRKTITKEE
ncbi:MAG: bifunctional DNA primase/polymerase [Candidatus Zambryskibacteria bacterium]|nr:bifunctional DNA primase/polymerase [Candidatus Zambryskibacteria bacterium]